MSLPEASKSDPPAELHIPITEGQREVWALCQWSPEASASCNECWTLDLRGPLDTPAFLAALQLVAARHASLRSSFDRSGESLVVSPAAVLEIPFRDLSGRDQAGRETELAALRQAESARTFDLKRAPLLTLHLVRLAADHHALVFNAHHLICDGWSCDIFLQEAAEIYSAGVESRPPRLSAPDAPQVYQQWEAAMQKTPEFAADATYWLSRFRTIPTALEVPGDRPRPFRRSYRGASETLILPADFPKALQLMGARRGATLFSVLFSGFVLLLRRLGNQNDLVVGVPSAGQSLAGTEHLISHCVNLLPVRIECGDARVFSDLLSLVQANVVDAFDHRRVTFGWLMRQLVMPRDPSRPPLVSVTFNLDPPLSGLRFAGLAHRLEANPRSAFQFDLGVNCDTSADGFRIICHYNRDLFDGVTIQGLLDQFRRLLESVSVNPDEPLASPPAGSERMPAVAPPRPVALSPQDLGEAKTVRIMHAPRTRSEPALAPAGSPRSEKKLEPARVPSTASAPTASGNGGSVAVEDAPAKTLRIQYPRGAVQSAKPATVSLPAAKPFATPGLSLLHGLARPFPREVGLHEIFAAQASSAPDALAIDAGGERITYAELDRRAEALAERLRADVVAFGGSVGICLERSPEFIVSALAILKAGAAYVPLDPAYPAERLASMIEDAAVGLIISRSPFSALAFPADIRILSLDAAETSGPRPQPRSATGSDLAYVMFTSGSTGRPKGAQVLHRGVSRLVVNADYVEFTAADVVAHVSNVSFDAATFEVWGALLNGASLVVVAKEALLSPRQFLADLREKSVTVLFLTTPLFHQMAREVPEGFGFLRYLVVGGDALDPGAARLVLESGQPPKFLVNGYGPTETTTFAVCHHVTLPLAATVPIGRPIANTQVYLLDVDRHPVPLGEEGEIYIGGPGVARGYANRSGQTHLHFLSDPYAEAGALMYKTGDRARVLPDGVIEFLGRYDDQVKIRGFRVEPAEVEAVLRSHPEVGLCKVRAQAIADQEKTLIGYVTARNGRVPQPKDLRAFLKKRLPDYLIPRALVVLDYFPLTPNGKIDVAALPLPSTHSGGDQIAPRTEVEKGIAVLWQEILGPGSYSVTDDFFLSGGHSLLAIQLISRIAQRFDVDVPVRQLFETPTIKGLADFVQAELAPPGTEAFKLIVPIQRGNPKRRPLYLVPGGWGGEVEFLVYAQLARHIDLELPVFGLRAHRNEKGQTTDDSVETMAANYLREIREFQPEGPYLLGGECVGGIIAYEMARQLDDEGEKTELLLMLDTDRPSAALRLWFSAFERSERWSAFWEWRVRQPFESHRVKLSRLSLAGKIRYVWDRLFRKRSWHSAEPSPDDLRVLSEYPRKLMSHTPRPYRGKMTLLVDEKSHETNGALGWEGVHTGEMEVHVLPGDHISYIREHAPAAAEKLRAILARAK